MNVWAIFLIYASLVHPEQRLVPASTAALDSQADCVAVTRRLEAEHAFDRPGMKLVFAGCERVTILYRTDGTKL